MAAVSPASRALRVLTLIQDHPGITADRLADQLGVTPRAARRYVAILRDADIPVESARGPYGGYRLGRGIRLPPLVFTATEALGLVMAVLDGSHPVDDGPVGAALGKLIRALPEHVGRPAATIRQHASAVPTSLPRPDPEQTIALVTAVARQRRVCLGYRSRAGAEWAEEVDPWAVVVRHGLWYLLCHSHRVNAVRTYRIDRVTAVRECAETFEPPLDLDPVPLLETQLGTGREFETKVVFAARYAEVARFVTPPMGRLEPLDDDRCLLVGSTSNPAMVAGEWLSAMPFAFRVEGGPELRAAVSSLAERLSAAV
ncbi:MULTISPECIES: YafY family protein [unclassified Crossiella]|uniref:helix-turn-helix transcriptional regulator n=1 Tax=unclassified Crossiella TaxID=2620835 RepID=UPI001FFEA399|nr:MULTISPECIES: WYL domain-containing protein [unclassified Crossiella]MCK2244793.1 WYL domain-containing protein [Crossiella sp. S99.2]MCK2258435.1 WYL domain-containing protein [Crossiella sp. S99.1]